MTDVGSNQDFLFRQRQQKSLEWKVLVQERPLRLFENRTIYFTVRGGISNGRF